MNKLLVTVFAFFSGIITGIPDAFSQPPQSWTSAEMYLGLRKLNVLGSVLYVAAHPDDENTRLITYLSKDKLYRTGYLSMTRGDGGQNLIGDEQGVELGLIRTQELLAARRVDGGEQFFSRAYDFGYSKNPDETFTKWHRDKILSDVVWVIRKFQPDVVITRFPTTGEGGHGHHTASAILAKEAFSAAADPAKFTEQLNFVKVWQPKRVLWNSFNFGGTNLTSPDQFKIDVGGYNPLLGKSYGEIAAISRSNHKSQGFGATASRGEVFEYFKTLEGDAPASDLMDGVVLGWARVGGSDIIEKMIEALVASFDFLNPEKSVPALVSLYKRMNALPDGYWKTQKLKEVQELIAQCSGLFLDATSNTPVAVQTDSIRVNFSVNNRLGVKAILKKVGMDAFDSSFNIALSKNKNFAFAKTFIVPATKAITQPYWLANKMEEGYFNVNDIQKIGQPDADPSFMANVLLNVEGEDFHFIKPVKYKFTDPVRGELYEPLVVLPSVEFDFVSENNFSINDSNVNVQLHFKSNLRDSVYYPVSINHSDKWSINNNRFTYGTFQNRSNFHSSTFRPIQRKASNQEVITVSTQKSNATQFSGYRRSISYDHIPVITYFKDARANLLQLEVNIYNKKIGYIIGAGDKVPEALEQMGYEVTLLTDKELSRNNLKQFDAILTGVRAYNTNEWMNNHYDKLMKYVNDGGNLVVQYNTSSNIGPVKAKIAPYKFDISRTRITDENAPVRFLIPGHAVFNFPNKITPEDFKGWIQERSIYHAGAWDSTKFQTVLSMNDPGEKSEEGGLVIAKHGKGVFVYTGIVFFRQLPAGVPGAFRLLANIIALNRKKGF